MHPDVVLGDVLLGARDRFGDPQLHLGRHAPPETLPQASLGPLTPAPLGAVRQPLLQRCKRKIQKDRERHLVVEQVVGDVRGGIVAGEGLIVRHDRPEIEIRLGAQGNVDFVHVAVELFEQPLAAREQSVDGGLVAREVLAGELLERAGVPVGADPEVGDLLQSALDTGALSGPVLGGQFRLHLRHRTVRSRKGDDFPFATGSGIPPRGPRPQPRPRP